MNVRFPSETDYLRSEELRESVDEYARQKGLRADTFLIRFNPWTDQAETYFRLYQPHEEQNDHTDTDTPDNG